jgi:hypothetical protein
VAAFLAVVFPVVGFPAEEIAAAVTVVADADSIPRKCCAAWIKTAMA